MTNLTFKVWPYDDIDVELWMGAVYYKEQPIKYMFNHPTEQSCIDRCEAYIKHTTVKPNPAKGMGKSIFVNDLDGSRLVWL